MERLRVGIAGYGVVGRRRKTCVDAHEKLETVAVCDRLFPEATELEDGTRALPDLESLLECDLDVLIICLTNDVAAQATIDGLEKGLHVFCEKPPGRDVADIQRVIDTAIKYPELKLKYGFNHRYHFSVQEALRRVKSGQYGKVINLRGVYGKSQIITFNQDDWRTKRDVAGGGVLLDQGIHMVDLMRLFAGEFMEVNSFVSNSFWGYDVEDNAYALMKSQSGIVAMLNSSATQWRHRFNLEINLERGSLILGGILSGSKSYGAETLTVVSADPASDNGDPAETKIRYNKDPSWTEEIKEFASAIFNDYDVSNGKEQDALNTMQLVYRIYFADKQWRETFNITNPDN
jgi:predicted dehydrogenase